MRPFECVPCGILNSVKSGKKRTITSWRCPVRTSSVRPSRKSKTVKTSAARTLSNCPWNWCSKAKQVSMRAVWQESFCCWSWKKYSTRTWECSSITLTTNCSGSMGRVWSPTTSLNWSAHSWDWPFTTTCLLICPWCTLVSNSCWIRNPHLMISLSGNQKPRKVCSTF